MYMSFAVQEHASYCKLASFPSSSPEKGTEPGNEATANNKSWKKAIVWNVLLVYREAD